MDKGLLPLYTITALAVAIQAKHADFGRSIASLAPTELQQLADFSNLLQATVYDRLGKQKNANLEL
jgi:hypothetical protein